MMGGRGSASPPLPGLTGQARVLGAAQLSCLARRGPCCAETRTWQLPWLPPRASRPTRKIGYITACRRLSEFSATRPSYESSAGFLPHFSKSIRSMQGFAVYEFELSFNTNQSLSTSPKAVLSLTLRHACRSEIGNWHVRKITRLRFLAGPGLKAAGMRACM